MRGSRAKRYIVALIVTAIAGMTMYLPLAGIFSAEIGDNPALGAACGHVHDESCGGDKEGTGDEGAECTHDCSGGVCPEAGKAPEGWDEAPDVTILTTFEPFEDRYSYASGAITLDELMLSLPALIAASDADGDSHIIEVTWYCWEFDPAPEKTTEYIFMAAMPWDYKFDENVDKPQISVTISTDLAGEAEKPREERIYIDLGDYSKTHEIGTALFDALGLADKVYVSGYHSASYFFGHAINLYIPRGCMIVWSAYFVSGSDNGGEGLIRISGSGDFVLAGGALMNNACDFSAITITGSAALFVEGGTIYGAPAILIDGTDQSTTINGGTVCSRKGPAICSDETQNITVNGGFVYSGGGIESPVGEKR